MQKDRFAEVLAESIAVSRDLEQKYKDAKRESAAALKTVGAHAGRLIKEQKDLSQNQGQQLLASCKQLLRERDEKIAKQRAKISKAKQVIEQLSQELARA